MNRRASRLAEYTRDRLGEDLRAVGYHTSDEFDIVYARENVAEQYPPDRIEQFIRTSRNIHTDLQYLDRGMGAPEASLHVLDEGLILQFHFDAGEVVFLSMDKAIGRNFTRFIDDCQDHMT